DVVAATMSKPGVVLKRPAGSNGRFAEHSDLPSDLESAGKGRRREGRRTQPAKKPPRKTEAALAALAERHAALRVGFADDGERPVQVVRREARPRWRAFDWSKLDPEVAERRMQELLAD